MPFLKNYLSQHNFVLGFKLRKACEILWSALTLKKTMQVERSHAEHQDKFIWSIIALTN